MIASALISDMIPSVKSTDAIGRALDWMNEFKTSLLPVVDDGKYVGMIQENDILDAEDFSGDVSSLRFASWENAYVYGEQHLYEAIRIMSSFRMDVVPVLDEDQSYLGVITLRDISFHLKDFFAVQEPGGIIVLAIPNKGYVLSEIGRIVESVDAKVLSLYLSSQAKSSDYLITLKLNVEDLSRVISTFERFDYVVVKTYYNTSQLVDYKRNLDALMNYLDI